MNTAIDTNFYIDRMFGFPILIPVKDGIVQEFNDHEYHGHLAKESVGKHINVLANICKKSLHGSWIKHWGLGIVYEETGIRDQKFYLAQKENQLQKESNPQEIKKLETQMENIKEKIKNFQMIIDSAKDTIFIQHGIKL